MKTRSSRNEIWSSATFQVSLAKLDQPRLIWRAACCTAIPFRSVPDDAAVADVFGTLSVEVGGDVDAIEPDAEFFGRHLRDFLKQALAHFGAAVIEVNGAVLIDVHQRAGLIEVRERERNAEFHRRQRDAALQDRRARVEVLDLGAPPPVARRAL